MSRRRRRRLLPPALEPSRAVMLPPCARACARSAPERLDPLDAATIGGLLGGALAVAVFYFVLASRS